MADDTNMPNPIDNRTAPGKFTEQPGQQPAPSEVTPSPAPSDPPAPEPAPPAPEPAAPAAPSLEEKFAASSQEGQRLFAENKKLLEKVGVLTKEETPTEAELVAEYPNWEYLSDFEKKSATDNLGLRKKLAATNSLVYDLLEQQGWEREFVTLSSKPEYSGLKGREQEFKQYAYQSRFFVDAGNGRKIPVDIQIVANSFLQEHPPAPAPVVVPVPPENPTPTLEPGSGGESPAQPTAMSDEEKAQLRKFDPKRYNELLKKGLI